MFKAGANLSLRLAQTQEDHQAAQRLRYRVFIQELGGDGALVDHTNQFEIDRFDTFFDHLVLIDERRSRADLEHVVGVYRLLRSDQAARAGQFYTEDEYVSSTPLTLPTTPCVLLAVPAANTKKII